MKQKPQYLYHGSQSQIGVIKPMQAHGVCDAESQQAIYAAATMEEVIPFALPFRRYPDSPEGKRSFESNGINSYLRYGSIDPNGKGYIYVLPSESFELIDEWEWISRTEVKPVEVIEIKVKDYLHTITFSEEAERIQQKLYGRRNRMFESDFAKIEYLESDNVVLHTWKKEAHFDDYRKPVTASLEMLREHKDSIFVVDARNGFEDVKEDVEWGFCYFLPELRKNGCKV